MLKAKDPDDTKAWENKKIPLLFATDLQIPGMNSQKNLCTVYKFLILFYC